ncbi:MAG: hypothetical protein AB7P23_12305 [Amphiplicatus sp.]
MYPTRFNAGDTVVFDVASLSLNGENIGFPAWTLTYRLRGNGQTADIAGAGDGSGWTVTIAAATSVAYTAGVYSWSVDVSHGDGRRFTIAGGTLEVLANFATATGAFDGRTQSQKDLDAIDAAIRARLTGGAISEYTIGNRNLRYESIASLRQLRSEVALRVANERNAAAIADGLASRKRIGVRFVNS